MTPRTKPIRVTLDLDPKLHRALRQWCNTAAAKSELASVSFVSVFRHLVDMLVTDDNIAQQVQARLEAEET